jgi:two-component system alkaline phosphatase synthesis response regulator PhoP
MNKFKILIVEDEINLGETLKDFLESKDYECLHAVNAMDARKNFDSLMPHVVLMDINLPDGNGIELAKEFRTQDKELIILFLSAMNDPETKFSGLSMGAEDYITKPFDVRELILRLERILSNKVSLTHYQDEITLADLKIWFKRFEVQDGNGEVLSLSQKECQILEMLYQSKNDVVSRDQIIEKVWGINSFPSNRTVDNYIVSLRKWIDSSKEGRIQIASVRGIGYKLIIKD